MMHIVEKEPRVHAPKWWHQQNAQGAEHLSHPKAAKEATTRSEVDTVQLYPYTQQA